jgi:peptidoglycan/LPS O-acetylase OafA/YrhL
MEQRNASRHVLVDDETKGLLDDSSASDGEDKGGIIFRPPARSMPGNCLDTICLAVNRCLAPCPFYISRIAVFLLPSFLQPRVFSHAAVHSRRLHPTAYLDGLRGLAALFVVFCHWSYTSFVVAEGWGYQGRNYNILRLPIVRLFYTGPAMVAIFFVVSGYALSLKPLKLVRSKSDDGGGSLVRALGSSVFRRGIRLFVPTAASTLLVVFMIRIGLYEWTREFAGDRRYVRYPQEEHYRRLGTTWEQLRDWMWQMFYFVRVWGWEKFGGSTGLDQHLWTIPVEFRASMYLFLAMIGTAGLKPWARRVTVVGLMCFTYRSDRWDMLLFFAGMLLAEWDLARGAHGAESSLLPNNVSLPRPRRVEQAVAGMWVAVGIVGLFLLSQPNEGHEDTPGWVFLSSLIPEWWSEKDRYWQSIGAVLLLLCVAHSPTTWQLLLNTRIVQYFGKISYAIYLMHGPVLHTAGFALQRWAWGITGVRGLAYNLGFMLSSVLVMPLLVWVADVFWRLVDAPVVRFARWLEGKCSVQIERPNLY